MKTAIRLMLVVVLLGFGLLQKPATSVAQSIKPNIIFIIADDLDSESMNHLPRLQSLLADREQPSRTFSSALRYAVPPEPLSFADNMLTTPKSLRTMRRAAGFRSSAISAVRSQRSLLGSVMRVIGLCSWAST